MINHSPYWSIARINEIKDRFSAGINCHRSIKSRDKLWQVTPAENPSQSLQIILTIKKQTNTNKYGLSPEIFTQWSIWLLEYSSFIQVMSLKSSGSLPMIINIPQLIHKSYSLTNLCIYLQTLGQIMFSLTHMQLCWGYIYTNLFKNWLAWLLSKSVEAHHPHKRAEFSF